MRETGIYNFLTISIRGFIDWSVGSLEYSLASVPNIAFLGLQNVLKLFARFCPGNPITRSSVSVHF